ncbi:hypothetical protein BEL04_02470 [Mucilaginibacter sp. PPCGB 2223]|uniref:hypothetical protein n=1 Tax=Mucilaginibacter sp. PPCGB 2223 TaxID=1886027 RepID=UPI00082437A9|nr:hypothetical protein [Mucilaginibacter sp. PPCGB 2223]OCX53195.1 hypothetical protein BEL04_02470 [Mucilaginibacter sp. PPCGB 2223]
MLNRVTAILLIVFTLSANFSKLFIFAGFELNKTTIASTLCENRNKPWMHCNGRCYLLKKIKQAEEKEKSEERQTGKSLFQEGIVTHHFSFNYTPRLLAVLTVPTNHTELPDYSASVFQPPKISA